jgi:serine/threonine-protein kinase
LALVENLSQVVSYLHRQGVSHGNLKLSNVLLAADGIPLLTDFSPAGGLFQSRLADDANVASVGRLAPELVEDIEATPGPAADVYGLGVILYELLTGQKPFRGDTMPSLMMEIMRKDPRPASSVDPSVHPAWDDILKKVLAKNRAERYAAVKDFALAVRDCNAR